MKRLFYSLMIALAASLAFTACTEEEVTPSTELDNGGGEASDPIKRN